MKTFESERLLFRPFNKGDVDAVFAFSANKEVTLYTGDAGFVKNMEDAMNVIENVWLKDYKQYGYGRYAVVDKASNQVIGFSGLKYLSEYDLPDLGYRFLPEYWGKGLGYEAGLASLKFARDVLRLETVLAFAMPENKGSVRILEKLGFANKGMFEDEGESFIHFEINQEQMRLV